jgi:hypothetical protein
MKGFIAEIFKSAKLGDGSKNGVSSKVNQVTIIDRRLPQFYEPTEDAPAVTIHTRTFNGVDYIYAKPIEIKGKRGMMGGTFIYTCDSRFTDISRYPIPLHDRVED